MSENEKLSFTARAREIIYDAAGPESEWSPYDHRLLDLAQVADGDLVDAADALTAAEARIKMLTSERDAAALHGYQIAVNDLTVFRVKIAEPFDTSFETHKQFCLDMLNRNLRQMHNRQALTGASNDG